MSGNKEKIVSVLFYVIAGISIIIAAFFYFGSEKIVVVGTEEYKEPSITNFALLWAYLLILLTILITLIFMVIHVINHPKVIKSVLIVLVSVAACIALSYFLLASGKQLNIEDITISAQGLKWVDTGLYISYFFLAAAFLGLIYSEVIKIFK